MQTLKLFLFFYSFLWRSVTPILRHNKRLKEHFSERLVPKDWPYLNERKEKNRIDDSSFFHIWIQAASGGEARLLSPLVKNLEKLLSNLSSPPSPLRILCTTFTKQGMEVLEAIKDSTIHSKYISISPRYFPLDSPPIMEKAIKQIKPSCIVLLETELWPGLMASAKSNDIPIMIFNGRITKKSAKGYSFFSNIFKRIGPKKIFATSQEDQYRFSKIFTDASIHSMRNIKFDVVAQEIERNDTIRRSLLKKIYLISPDIPVVSFASVREQEEKILFTAIRELYQKKIYKKRFCILIAPRHLHRIDSWEAFLKNNNMSYTKSSSNSKLFFPIILFDSFGELNNVFLLSDTCFIGGSLAPLGGQNFLEPLSHGVIPIIGSSWSNFYWVGNELIKNGLVKQISNEQKLITAIVEQLQSIFIEKTSDWDMLRDTHCKAVQKKFKKWLLPNTGGSFQAAEEILLVLGLKS